MKITQNKHTPHPGLVREAAQVTIPADDVEAVGADEPAVSCLLFCTLSGSGQKPPVASMLVKEAFYLQ